MEETTEACKLDLRNFPRSAQCPHSFLPRSLNPPPTYPTHILSHPFQPPAHMPGSRGCLPRPTFLVMTRPVQEPSCWWGGATGFLCPSGSRGGRAVLPQGLGPCAHPTLQASAPTPSCPSLHGPPSRSPVKTPARSLFRIASLGAPSSSALLRAAQFDIWWALAGRAGQGLPCLYGVIEAPPPATWRFSCGERGGTC